MAEQLNLTSPEIGETINDWKVTKLSLNWPGQLIVIELTSNINTKYVHQYSGQTATDFMIILNKINLSIKSLQRRILERLIADGVKLGSIIGAPD